MLEATYSTKHGSPEKPLRIGEILIECYVLDDGRRVLLYSDIQRAIGLAEGGSMVAGKTRLEHFVSGSRLARVVSTQVRDLLAKPIRFRKPVTGHIAYGVEAQALPAICEAVVSAARLGILQEQQLFIAHQCEVILSGLTVVGIVALVDETTGFQKVREEGELRRILEAYVRAEHRPWLKSVPNDFFKELFRVYGWKYTSGSRGPRYAGKLVRQLIYKHLPKPVLPALDQRNPADSNWQRKQRHHQLLTDGIGLEHFKAQLVGVMALLRASSSKAEFLRLYNRAYGAQTELDL
ncbi:P63C domain-containing protein [Tianweitania sp. BSSL-BM11]|uniref:P63C domain-containing protein n=1 Tax=Tianweitania aestuarii TaxID=2814886 RepID=A0ABS5RU50_9HYPH|nr:P63C domain-containing protein [Tianweitania aestuarii]MBS9720570.1 P63C domain-containing protein [Tianweitania aestuarii]